MSRFAWTPPTKLKLGNEKSRPRTAPDLLDDLGVSAAPEQTQRQAVNSWLVGHPPDDLMQTSLRSKGLPTAPLTVAPASERYVHVMAGTATFVAEDTWHQSLFDVFPRYRPRQVYVFHTTAFFDQVFNSVEGLDEDPFQPERRRDGTRVS
jgi:hypothetical protein